MDMQIEITFTEAEMVNILKQYLKSKGYNVTKHNIKIAKKSHGDQRDNWTTEHFQSISFTVRDNKGDDIRNPYDTLGINRKDNENFYDK